MGTNRNNCAYCRRKMNYERGSSLMRTKDHVVPKSRGGSKVVPCCLACNHLKADMSLEEWASFRNQNPEWWKLYKVKRNPTFFEYVEDVRSRKTATPWLSIFAANAGKVLEE